MRKAILFFLSIFLLATLPVLAIEETTPSSFSTEKINEKIKERLEKTATESAQQSDNEEEKNQPETGKYYAWVGTLKKVEKSSLFIETMQGEKKAENNEETTILQTSEKGKRTEVSLEELEEGNFIIAIGTLEGETIMAKRVISTPPLQNSSQKKLVFGKVAEIEEEKITLKNSEENTLSIGKDTSIRIKGVEKPKAGDIELEDKVYAVVVVEKEKITETKAIFVIPGKNNPENETKKKLSPAPPATASGETTEETTAPEEE